MKRRLFTTILVFVMLLLFISSPLLLQQKTSAQGNPPPPDLFGSASTPPGYLPPDAQSTIRSRFVTVDSGQLTPQTASLTLNLFPDTSYLAVFEESTVPDPLTPGRFIWQGAIDGIPDGHATLAVNEESLAVTVYLPNALYHIIDTGEGPFFVSQTTLDDPMPEMAPIPVSLPPDQAEIQTPQVDDGSIIDVMVLYTPAARTRYGQPGIESIIDLAVTETNRAYLNSQVNTQLRLVYKGEIIYTEGSSMNMDIERLRTNGDGYIDEVHALRDTYRADVVNLIEENAQVCGIAYQMTTLSQAFESTAFSVVASNCATGYYSFGHELGHNMGAQHDRANGTIGLYPYSYGYWAPNNSFRTIMAYNCPVPCQRIQYFSNPTVTYNGLATGVSLRS